MKPTPVEMRPPKAPGYQHTWPLGDESNLPATVIEAEKKAILVALTLGGYQKQRYIRHPGLGISKVPPNTGVAYKKPASAIPRNTRQTMRPSYVVTAAVQQVTIPHDTMIREIHREGVKYFMAMLDGNSKRT
jgi:hypothetical protein